MIKWLKNLFGVGRPKEVTVHIKHEITLHVEPLHVFVDGPERTARPADQPASSERPQGQQEGSESSSKTQVYTDDDRLAELSDRLKQKTFKTPSVDFGKSGDDR